MRSDFSASDAVVNRAASHEFALSFRSYEQYLTRDESPEEDVASITVVGAVAVQTSPDNRKMPALSIPRALIK